MPNWHKVFNSLTLTFFCSRVRALHWKRQVVANLWIGNGGTVRAVSKTSLWPNKKPYALYMNETFLKIHEFEPKKINVYSYSYILVFVYKWCWKCRKKTDAYGRFFVHLYSISLQYHKVRNNEYFFWIHLEGTVL